MDIHRHRCKCGHIWEHDGDALKGVKARTRAHTCPACGEEEWYRYTGSKSPTPVLRQHSDIAWNIAAIFSDVLASETRDLAAQIDVALNAEREACAKLALKWEDQSLRVAQGVAQAIRERIT